MISYATLTAAQDGKVAPWTNTVPELSNTHIAVFRDAYPVTEGHLLFVPRANTDESIVVAMGMALLTGRQMVQNNQCDAFNVGLNMGVAAGQTVMYPHVHLIPRRAGDCADPVGGVRGVIPGQSNYKTTSYQKS
jgi:diadenosine tetraphosphate (Ap4A) HIT family hydrolase